jgi:hypothetical protein
MSFELFLQCFDRGEPAGIPRVAIRSCFPIREADSELNRWSVRYDDTNSCEVYVDALSSDPDLVAGLMISRPCGDVRLWNALLAIMRLGRVTLYFPGGDEPLIASPETVPHLPPSMVEALGEPRVVTSGQEILDSVLAR